jgi:serine/threonine protein kinase
LQGRGPSSADDTWALHAVLFAALTGGPPFRGDTKDQLLQSIASGQLGRLSDFGISDPSLQEIVEAGLIANLARRRANVDQLLEALERWEPRSERSPQAADWEEDAATVVASNSDEVAAMMEGAVRGAAAMAGPSMPPVPVSDYDDTQAERQPPDMARGYEDEDDQTTVMDREPVEEVRRAVAQHMAKGAPPPRRAPPPPGFASATQRIETPGSSENPYDHTTPYLHSPFADEPPVSGEPPEIPSAAFGPRSPAPQPPTQPGGFPHPAAFPPAAPQFSSAYPPSIPAPGPTGIQIPVEDVEFRKANRKPLVVIAILLVLIALGMTVLLILNYRGVIT